MVIRNRSVWIASITIIWMLTAMLTSVYEYFFLANYQGVLDTLAMQEYDFGQNLIAAIIWGFLGGLVFGLLEVLYFQKHLSRRSFLGSVFLKLLIYSAFLIVLNILVSFLFNSVLSSRSLTDPQAIELTRDFITSISFWHPVIPFMALAFISSVILQLSDRFGDEEIWKIISGSYFKPKEEERIFMFLDLNSSTTIAEKLGNEGFYQFLNDFFFDISEAIVQNRGEVVEYVGDEVVITWTMKKGLQDARCLKIFSDIESKINSKAKLYQKKYGVVPEFKAAVHCGDVMIGEIGRIKKSIKYSGDVLNTTARVESLCNEIGARLAVTGTLVSQFEKPPYKMEKVSNILLKGKEKLVDVFKVW